MAGHVTPLPENATARRGGLGATVAKVSMLIVGNEDARNARF